MDEDSGAVRVVVRVRPINEREQNLKSDTCVSCPLPQQEPGKRKKKNLVPNVCVLAPGGADRTFVFDRVFDSNSEQDVVYDEAAKPIVDSVLKGFNGTVMAYGQTGSGKTHTMQGYMDFEKGKTSKGGELFEEITSEMGVIPRMIHTVFQHVASADEHIEFSLKVSIFEIYMERIRDLLDTTGSKDNLKIREDAVRGVFVDDLSEWSVGSVEEVFDSLVFGHANRSVAATQMNATSSRSHLVFQMVITQRNMFDLSQKVGKLYLVDLAGSEKLSKTHAEGMTLEEGKLINKSLSCLGNVINSLTSKGKRHIPYRDSKLTRVLQDSLGGNSQTCLVCTASPATCNDCETLSTLRFGQRAKEVQNKPVINEERSVEELERLLRIANAYIDEQDLYIVILETLLTDNKLSPPPRPTAGQIKAETNKKKKEKSGNQGAGNEDEDEDEDDIEFENEIQGEEDGHTVKKSIKEIKQDEARAERDDELQDQRIKLKQQSERISELSRELAIVTENLQKTQQEATEVREKVSEDACLQEKLFDEKHDMVAKLAKIEIEKVALKDDNARLKKTIQQLKEGTKEKENKTDEGDDGDDDGELGDLPDDLAALLPTPPPPMITEHMKVSYDDKENSNSQSNAALGDEDDDSVLKLKKKIVDLEVALSNEKRKCHKLKEMFKDGEKPLRNKMSQLDRHLEQLTVMYHKLASQNSTLKVELQVNEKKLQRREQRVSQLEKAMQDGKARYEKLLNQCATLTAVVEQLQVSGGLVPGHTMQSRGSASGSMFVPMRKPRIVKPLRGGTQYTKSVVKSQAMAQ